MGSRLTDPGYGSLRRRRFLELALLAPLACRGSNERSRSGRGKIRLGFKHQPLGSNPAPLRELIAGYAKTHPEVDVISEALPNASDVAHQYFLTALEGGAQHFDVFVLDLIWTPEFARAGWIADLSTAFPSEKIRRDFLPGLVDSAVIEGRTFAVPWYVDVGLLYYRRDLVPSPPRSYQELERFTIQALRANPHLQGYLWQGRQYEGLVCNVLEAIWGHGGSVWSDGRLRLETPEARAALGYLRSLLIERVSPASVRSAAEEDSRRVFQNGGAVFMRNWPYAWGEIQRQNSAVRDKVGVASLPTTSGEPGHGTLGGWHLALNARSPERNRPAAIQFIEHLTSLESNFSIAVSYGRNPPRRATYRDPRLAKAAPSIPALLPILETARSRPATPYYNLLSDVLQSEFSAAIAGIRAPEAALRNAQSHVDRITAQGT
jgi:multiple sugar transport system substrate-binding protein